MHSDYSVDVPFGGPALREQKKAPYRTLRSLKIWISPPQQAGDDYMQDNEMTKVRDFWLTVKLMAENSLKEISLLNIYQETLQKSHREAMSNLSSLLKEQI